MPQPPKITPPDYYRHNFDLGRFRFAKHDIDSRYAWFEPIDDEDGSPDSRPSVLAPEDRRVRYLWGEMIPFYR